jgi:cytochrome o ubiquinol oxidase subunit 2
MKKFKIALLLLICLGIFAAALALLFGGNIAVLNPKGMIGIKERNLLVTATLLMLIVVIPVLIMVFFFAWKYRESNHKAKYTPDWEHSYLAETIWWGVPVIIIFFLGWITWETSHSLDPFKPIVTNKKPLVVQVVALEWKWLFIYPEQKIATVNFVEFPENTPICFEITADAPMNSFWIPELGGQIYAMTAMRSKLHLIANEKGSFRGCSANISGEGFAGMTFTAKSTSDHEFDTWVKSMKQSKQQLNIKTYNELAKPTQYHPVSSYVLTQDDLFDQIIMKFSLPPQGM